MDHLYAAYRCLFARPLFARANRILLNLALRGLGILNYKNAAASGEAHFLRDQLAGVPSPVVVDVGANDGSYSRAALAIAPSARIIAFEPHPKSYERLKATLAPHANVSLHNVACSDISGGLELFDYFSHDGSSHASTFREVFDRLHHAASVSHTVPARTLDEVLEAEGVRQIRLLKIDAEGHEMRVLRGAERYLRNGSIDCIQLEFNEMNVFSRVFFKDIYDFLPDYKLYRLLPRGMLAIGAYEPLHCELFAYQNIVALRV